MNRDKAKEKVESEYLDILLQRCPYRIPKGEDVIDEALKGGGE